jgi:hypothetical protein
MRHLEGDEFTLADSNMDKISFLRSCDAGYVIKYKTDSLKARGIDGQRLAQLIDDAIESVPVVPVYRYRWQKLGGCVHLIVKDESDESTVAFLSEARSSGFSVWYSTTYQVVSTIESRAKALLIEALNIDPSEVQP